MGACDGGSIYNRVKKLPQNAIRWQWGGGDLWELVTGVAYINGLKNCHKMQSGGSGVEVRLEACDGVR